MRLKKYLSAQARAPSPPHPASYAAPPPSRPASYNGGSPAAPSHATLAFPEPQLYRTTSYQTALNAQQQQQHYSSFSDDARFRQQNGLGINRNESVFSLESSFSQDIDDNFDVRVPCL